MSPRTERKLLHVSKSVRFNIAPGKYYNYYICWNLNSGIWILDSGFWNLLNKAAVSGAIFDFGRSFYGD